MILSDKDIISEIKKGKLLVEPFDAELVQPSSIDLRLSDTFRIFKKKRTLDIRKKFEGYTKLIKSSRCLIKPGQFILGSTLERVRIPEYLVARMEGKSSLGRLGIIVHCTAGYVDPGFDGNLTLEMSNVGPNEIILYPRMCIAQLSFLRLTSTAANLYGERNNKYQHQCGPTESRIYKEFIR